VEGEPKEGTDPAGADAGARAGAGEPGSAAAPPRGWRAQLRHAFAVERSGPAEPTPEERAALEPLIAEVRKRGLVGPAVLFLESVAPLNNVGAQALHFMQPIATAVLDPVRYATLAKYLERRGSVAWVVGELQRDTAAGR
jgi:hypothetical protein